MEVRIGLRAVIVLGWPLKALTFYSVTVIELWQVKIGYLILLLTRIFEFLKVTGRYFEQ